MRTNLFLLGLITLISCAVKPEQQEQPPMQNINRKWWKEAIVYQIYPRSFKDTNGDGVGDLPGIIEKLDYVKSLGVTAVWLNPIYASPNADNGYDVSDYRSIMADFGTMEDFDRLLAEMHKRELKLVMDIVVNHSSDEHEWFKQSRSSRTNRYRNYYHWWPAEKGKPNYRYSLFDENGDAWKYDKQTNAYYLHYFSDRQPDLNWENPELRNEVYDIMKFWADKGVDGFRLDAFQFVAKDTTFPALPAGLDKNFMQYYAMQGNIHDYLREMNEKVFSKYDVMSVAEGAGRSFDDAHKLVDEDRKELNMAYAFDGVDIAKPDGYKISTFKNVFTAWDSAFADKGWLSIFLANHDQARMVSRFGDDSDSLRDASAKLLNTFILSMRGTPYCYYGDELGMTNIGFTSIDQYKDIAAINGYKKAKKEGQDLDKFILDLAASSRDNGRTPMQWSDDLKGGFTEGKPWLPVNANTTTINVAAEDKDQSSVLNHFRQMTKLRKDNIALVYGRYDLINDPANPSLYAFARTLDNDKFLLLLNFSKDRLNVQIPEVANLPEPLINNYKTLTRNQSGITLEPYQAIIVKK